MLILIPDKNWETSVTIYRSGTPRNNTSATNARRTERYKQLFRNEGITANFNQVYDATFPAECFHPGIPGGHNGDFAPNNRDIYIGMAGGAMAIVDVDEWIIKNYVDVGVGTGPGHACFSEKHDMGIITTHGTSFVRVIDGINGDRPDMRFYQRYQLGFRREGLTDTLQSHSCYIDENEDFYYNFFTDGGVFFKIDLNTMRVVDSVYTGGIPIQGSYISLDDINSDTIDVLPAPVCDTGVDPQTIKQGDGTALWWWGSDEVTSASIDNGIGPLSFTSNYKWIYPTETTTYTMTANGAGETSTTCETTIIVEGQAEQNPPICEMGADPQIINTGEGTALWWWSDNVTSANIDNNIGSVATPSAYTWFYPTQTTTYTMNGVSSSGVTTSCNATITVQ